MAKLAAQPTTDNSQPTTSVAAETANLEVREQPQTAPDAQTAANSATAETAKEEKAASKVEEQKDKSVT